VKAYFFPFAAWFLCASMLGAQNTEDKIQPWFSSDIFNQHTLQVQANVNNGKGVELYRMAAGAVYKYADKYISGTVGLQYSIWTTDFVASGVWYPLRFKKVKIGIGALYHFGRFSNIEYEHDFFLGTYLAYQPFEHFYVNADVSGTIKMSHIASLPREINMLRDNGVALSIQIGTVFAKQLRIEAVVSSYEMFRYHLFINPTFSLNTAYVFKNGFYIEVAMGVRYSDIFTLTSHVDNYFGLFSFGITL